jgi:hypothetical protein
MFIYLTTYEGLIYSITYLPTHPIKLDFKLTNLDQTDLQKYTHPTNYNCVLIVSRCVQQHTGTSQTTISIPETPSTRNDKFGSDGSTKYIIIPHKIRNKLCYFIQNGKKFMIYTIYF